MQKVRESSGMGSNDQAVIDATRKWLKSEVIGLNLCPFAREVYAAERIRYVVSAADSVEALRVQLTDELRLLRTLDPAATETTLIIHPGVLGDFLEYNDFLDLADQTLAELELEGEFQIASFHPCYQFEGTEPDDVTNRTNRSPYPMLQILREASVERAIAEYPDVDKISERNMETMRRLAASPPPPESV
jgi:hypothetical protein